VKIGWIWDKFGKFKAKFGQAKLRLNLGKSD